MVTGKPPPFCRCEHERRLTVRLLLSPLNVIQFQALHFFSPKIVCDTRYANASFYTQSTQRPIDLPCDSLEGHFVSGAAQSRITPDALRHVMGLKEKSGICGLAIQFLPSASFPPR